MGRRVVVAFVVALVAAAGLAVAGRGAPRAEALPVAADDVSYGLCGRVFPDPHAHWPLPTALPTQSPWAKGNAVCRALDFLGYDETIAGLRYLESLLPGYVEVYDLSDPDGPFADVLDLDAGEGRSAGLPTSLLDRDPAALYAVRITDEASTQVPLADRERFVFALSIHGIERAGVEGGVRAAEDLATWAACEADASALPTCALNGPLPHPLLEASPEGSITAGEALRRAQVWFVMPNPDGWRRGDKQALGLNYQRYNGNGMDLNRDWPTTGFTYRPYTPWSEPETRSFGHVLRSIAPEWSGGIDLHGMQIDRAFSFTMIGGSSRPYDKDRRILQFVQGAWADAEQRLAWSPLIKPNDAPPSCIQLGIPPAVDPAADCSLDPRVYGVQWGTVWDTIAYTTTGDLSTWMEDGGVGLGADAVGNEMSLSHITNCVTGTCFVPDVEQLHVDGNKSLIYAMLQYTLLPEDTAFRFDGDAGWLDSGERVVGDGGPATPAAAAAPAPPLEADLLLTPLAPATFEFEVASPPPGGIHVEATSVNLQGISPDAFLEVAVDRADGAGGWEEVATYFNQSPIYLQAGAAVDVNSPAPGTYRVRVEGVGAGPVHVEVAFTAGLAWPDPGQAPYDVANVDFFEDLAPFAVDGSLTRVGLDELLDGTASLDGLASLVVADRGYVAAAQDPASTPTVLDPDLYVQGQGDGAGPSGPADAPEPATDLVDRLRAFVEGGGNLVLTDDALRLLVDLGVVPDGAVTEQRVYAGFVEFSLDGGATDTYADPLAQNVSKPGAAEGPGRRHQLAEPVPTGFAIQDAGGADLSTMPEWTVDPGAFTAAGGRVAGLAGGGVALGELPLGEGTIRVVGSLLPMPTTEYDHTFGLAPYGITYAGYEVLRNALDTAASVAPAAAPAVADRTEALASTAGPGLPATGPADVLLPAALAALAGLALRRRTR